MEYATRLREKQHDIYTGYGIYKNRFQNTFKSNKSFCILIVSNLLLTAMKKLMIIILIPVFFLCACEKSWYHEYIISNDTNVEVTIYAYDTDVEPVFNSDVININAKSQYSVLKGNGIDMDYQGVFTIGEVDSVVINFNNERSLIQSCAFEYGDGCNFDRNIMNFRNEQDFIKRNRGKASGQQQYSFTYTITQEDYNNAVPIEH
jgi:hypothetical protein